MHATGQSISAQANLLVAGEQVKRSGRSQNRLHTQKALIEFLPLGKVES